METTLAEQELVGKLCDYDNSLTAEKALKAIRNPDPGVKLYIAGMLVSHEEGLKASETEQDIWIS